MGGEGESWMTERGAEKGFYSTKRSYIVVKYVSQQKVSKHFNRDIVGANYILLCVKIHFELNFRKWQLCSGLYGRGVTCLHPFLYLFSMR